ncbi:MAG: hypothetical protein LUH54_01160 [Firmicutes bacterium]|nr:hypothetical protein [Bacillota bacterium]
MKQLRNSEKKARVKGERFGGLGIRFGKKTVVGEKLDSGVTVSEIVKYVLYALAGLLFLALETSFFSRIRAFDSTPDILIIAAAAVGFYENERAGAIFGAAVGFLSGIMGGVGISILPIVYMLVGYFCGAVTADYYSRSVPLFIMLDLVSCAVRLITTLIEVALSWSSFDLMTVFSGVLVPEFLSTLVTSPVPVLLLYPIWRIFRESEADTSVSE